MERTRRIAIAKKMQSRICFCFHSCSFYLCILVGTLWHLHQHANHANTRTSKCLNMKPKLNHRRKPKQQRTHTQDTFLYQKQHEPDYEIPRVVFASIAVRCVLSFAANLSYEHPESSIQSSLISMTYIRVLSPMQTRDHVNWSTRRTRIFSCRTQCFAYLPGLSSPAACDRASPRFASPNLKQHSATCLLACENFYGPKTLVAKSRCQ